MAFEQIGGLNFSQNNYGISNQSQMAKTSGNASSRSIFDTAKT
ncbi:MAG: hypothetical protein WCK67_09010 [bacterium]